MLIGKRRDGGEENKIEKIIMKVHEAKRRLMGSGGRKYFKILRKIKNQFWKEVNNV